jgi:La domain
MHREYYFSIDNLVKDIYLRKYMSSQGYVHLHIIAGFKRVQVLTLDMDMIRAVCIESDVIEIVREPGGSDYVRRKEIWEPWVLPIDERDESARNDGPKQGQALPPLSGQSWVENYKQVVEKEKEQVKKKEEQVVEKEEQVVEKEKEQVKMKEE